MAKHRRSRLACHGRSPFTDGRRPVSRSLGLSLVINLSLIIRLYSTYKYGERSLNFFLVSVAFVCTFM